MGFEIRNLLKVLNYRIPDCWPSHRGEHLPDTATSQKPPSFFGLGFVQEDMWLGVRATRTKATLADDKHSRRL